MPEPSTGIRQRHVDLTRATILQALVEIIIDGGLTSFSVQQVADRAGVSHRTVYRHFPGREDLLNGLMEWVEQDMVALGGRFSARDVEEFVAVTHANLGVFDALAEPVEAMTRFSLGTGIEPESRAERSATFAGIVESALPDADEEQRRMVAGVVRLLVSTRAWLVLRQDAVIARHETTDTVVWAVEVLLDAARAGRLPRSGGAPGPAERS